MPEEPLAPSLLDRFAALTDARGAVRRAEEIAPYLIDWRGTKKGAAELVLLPRNTDELAAIVRFAAKTRTALVPQGGNTGLVGGSVPEAEGSAILVSLKRMNRIRAIDAADFSATAEAGVVLEALHEAVAAEDRMFPLSLGAKGSATIGGLISTNAGGVQVLRYGPMRALVLGLEAVMPDGSVLDQLTPLRKDNTGYDIKQLLIGAEGTLGFVTAASLALVPAPKERATAFAGLESPEAALALLSRLKSATGGALSSFELLPRAAVTLVASHIPGARDPMPARHDWYALVEATSGEADGAVRKALESALMTAIDTGEAGDAIIAESERQADELWRLRDSIAEAERADGPSLKHDVSVPTSDMPRFMTEATEAIESRWPGMKVFAFGHLGDGNVHFNVRTDERMDRAALMALRDDVAACTYGLVKRFGGSISAEHGIGTLKAAALAQLGDPAKLAAMAAVKNALDRAGIMNPGKVFTGR